MQPRIITFFICFLFTTAVSAQDFYSSPNRPPLLWQKCLGGSEQDVATALVLKADGSIVVAGDSKSNDGDVTGHHGTAAFTDGWVVKLYNDTLIQWQVSLGGTADDNIKNIISTSDGGYLCTGITKSVDGDISLNHGGADVWIVKLSASGQIVWSKTYGGTNTDEGVNAIETSDGSYVITASTKSRNGDIHTSGTTTDKNAWIFKLNTSGNILWETSIDQGGFYANRDNSGIGVVEIAGNQLMACISGYDGQDTSFAYVHTDGIGDVYDTARIHTEISPGILYKIDLDNGSATYFTKTRGADSEYNTGILMTTDGNSIYLMYVASNLNFLVCNGGGIWGDLPSYLGYNTRVISRLNPETGAISNTFAATWDYVQCPEWESPGYNVSVDPGQNGFNILPGESWIYSGQRLTSTRGGTFSNDAVIEASSFSGNYGGTGFDRFNAIKTFPNGNEFICAGYAGFASDDVWGLHPPTDGSNYYYDKYDFWVTKISLNANRLIGKVFLDLNNNNQPDSAEPVYKRALVKVKKYATERIFSIDNNGHYETIADTGNYSVRLKLYDSVHYTATPVVQTVSFATRNETDTLNFAVHQVSSVREYTATLAANNIARPGFPVYYSITCSNNGTDTFVNRDITFVKDSHLVINGGNPAGAVVSGDTIKWQAVNILPGETIALPLQLQLLPPPGTNIGDTIFSYVLIDSTGDHTPSDNYSLLKQSVSGSYDPNDKAESHAGSITKLEVQRNNYLTYSIRFQNTGNDTAFNVVVRDSLDPKLLSGEFEMVSCSHPYRFKIEKGTNITWTMANINLVDSLHNEPGSHGYITYRVKPKNDLLIGEKIKNNAAIYFDFNLPVTTNTEVTIIKRTVAVWKGSVSSAWENKANWDINEVPDTESAVIIPANAAQFPEISSNAGCYSISVAPSASVIINSGYVLNVTGK